MQKTFNNSTKLASGDILTLDPRALQIMLAIFVVCATIVLFGSAELVPIKALFFGGVAFVSGMFAAVIFPVMRARRGYIVIAQTKDVVSEPNDI
jgi:hypothetical protein